MEFNISKKIGDKWQTLIKLAPSKFDANKLQAAISLSNARILVNLIENEGKEFKGEKYIYLPAFANKPKIDAHFEAKSNGYQPQDNGVGDLDDALPF